MPWNWQYNNWPNFTYNPEIIKAYEEKLLYQAGLLFGAKKSLNKADHEEIKIQLISNEALKTSEIEGDYLDRDSIQYSIKRHFGLEKSIRKIKASEVGITEMMLDLYANYNSKLTHQTLYNWHKLLMNGRIDLRAGEYRQTDETMQIISGRLDQPKIHFEAPASKMVSKEMSNFINWFNNSSPISSTNSLPALTRTSIAHLYFESIHPFEDGNGRIGRAICEKSLSEYFDEPILIAISTTINRNKKAYYQQLEKANQTLNINDWLIYFSETILESLNYAQRSIEFIIAKGRILQNLKGELNQRQEKSLLRLFAAGHEGFTGGLSADKYMKITKATRPTATRDLADMVKKKVLIKTGERKSTRYWLNLKE